MSIVSHSLPVPGFGTGEPVDVGDLVDSATVVLAGELAGDYVLCAGHDPSALVPVSRLNDDGQSEITALESLAYRYAAVRVVGNTQPSVGVTVVISGLSRPGENSFGTLAVLAPGSFGPQPSADTYALFPPTGLETELNLICRGSFEGPIIVEGSTNNLKWNPVASFQAGLTNTSFPVATVLEFAPVKIVDKVRYFRVVVTGRVLGTTYVTLGGRVPASGGGGGSPTGPAGGELTGTYPNPGLSTAAVQSKSLAVCDPAGAAATVQGNLNTHAGLTTSAHGGLIPSSAAGAPGGVATLAGDGKVPLAQLPPLSGSPTGPAGGELTGNYPNPDLATAAVQSKALAVCDPAGAAAAALAASEDYTEAYAVPTSRTISAGDGLTGGGNLSANLILSVKAADTSITVTVGGIAVNTSVIVPMAAVGSPGGVASLGLDGIVPSSELPPMVALTAKGDIASRDSTSLVVVPLVNIDGLVAMVDSTAPAGWTWQALPDGNTSQKGIVQVGTTAGTVAAGDDVRLVGARPYAGRVATVTRNGTTSSYSQDGRFNWVSSGAITNGGWYGLTWDPDHSRLVTISNGATSPGASAYSVDGGASWVLGGSLSGALTSWFLVQYDPYHKTLAAVPQSNSGAVYSVDGGTTWLPSASALVNTQWFGWAFDTVTNRLVMVSANSADTMYSEDGGVTWTAGGAVPNAMNGVCWDPKHDRLVAVPSAATISAYSTDGGTSWSNGGALPNGHYNAVVWDPIHERVLTVSDGTTQVLQSTDGGLTWTNAGNLGVGAVSRAFVFDQATGRVLLANTGGTDVWISETGGASWFTVASPTTLGPILAVAYP